MNTLVEIQPEVLVTLRSYRDKKAGSVPEVLVTLRSYRGMKAGSVKFREVFVI